VGGLTGTADGSWQYDSGSGWTNFPTSVGASSNGTALLLFGSDLIRFVPSKAFSGTVSLAVRAWYGSTGIDSGTILLSKLSTGGSNAFSTTTLTASCLVNSAPVLSLQGGV
jgi:large repetitive protein